MELLQNSWIAKLTTHTVWGFPINEIVHILSISVVVGVVMLLAANCGDSRRIQTDLVRRYVAPIFTIAFAVAFATGFIFFAAWPERYLNNPAFWIKIPLLLSLVTLNILILKSYREQQINSITKLFSYVAVAVAFATIAAGRLIAYVG
jgi:hypothetical protein